MLLKPRALTAHVLADRWATCMPGTSRSTYGSVFATERTMSMMVRTVTAAAASESASTTFDTELTTTLVSSSSVYDRRSSDVMEGVACPAHIDGAISRQ